MDIQKTIEALDDVLRAERRVIRAKYPEDFTAIPREEAELIIRAYHGEMIDLQRDHQRRVDDAHKAYEDELKDRAYEAERRWRRYEETLPLPRLTLWDMIRGALGR